MPESVSGTVAIRGRDYTSDDGGDASESRQRAHGRLRRRERPGARFSMPPWKARLLCDEPASGDEQVRRDACV